MAWLIEQMRELFFWIVAKILEFAIDALTEAGIIYEDENAFEFASAVELWLRQINELTYIIDGLIIITAAWYVGFQIRLTRKILAFLLRRPI